MDPYPLHPQLYEINTRVWLNSLSKQLGRSLTLGQVPLEVWQSIKELGMDLVWLMGVWAPSPEGIRIARDVPELHAAYARVLPDWTASDVIGSPYSVASYTLNPSLGEEQDLIRVRERLHQAGLGLVLDFVPNHTARDHPWVRDHATRYVHADSEGDFATGHAFSATGADGTVRWIAHGRDPYFFPWSDTAQLDAFRADTRSAMAEELLRIGRYCDGIRCDMAMLLLNDVFSETWRTWLELRDAPVPETEFWTEVIAPLKAALPQCILIAEAYWGLESEILGVGFDYAYDKQGYDCLRSGDFTAYKAGLEEEGVRSMRMVRFLENHDEDRLASVFDPYAMGSAAVVHATSPGMRLFYHGQLEGRRVRLPVQLGREPEEPLDRGFYDFCRKLLALTDNPLFKNGTWTGLPVLPAFPGDEGYRSLVGSAYRWEEETAVVVVNGAGQEASGYVRFPEGYWRGRETVSFLDRWTGPETEYVRDGAGLEEKGLYVRLGPHGVHFLTVRSRGAAGLPRREAS